MKSRLAKRLQSESNLTVTENLAKTYRSSLSAVLDFFYLAPTRQGQDNTDLFEAAFEENPNLAIKASFYLRDVRGGKGQRNSFRQILAYLWKYQRDLFDQLVPFVPEYGRWEDLIFYPTSESVVELIADQLNKDASSQHPSLLGKWMPSENVQAKGEKSKQTRLLARHWINALGTHPSMYRRLLSSLRRKLKVVETQMSGQEWGEINYSHVPSRAMKLYRKAFERNDPERFAAFIQKALKGEVSIKSSGVYPHEICAEFLHGSERDDTLEAMWNQLPNYFGEEERNVLVMVDVSESMTRYRVSGKAFPIDIATSIGVYCAERNLGAFHNLWITFSGRPEIQELKGSSLRQKLRSISGSNKGYNTDLQAAFQEILRYAKQDRVPAREMPSIVLVISDMEFDEPHIAGKTNFEAVEDQYRKAHYRMPLLVFWNVDARHNQVPVTKSEKNTFLVSGFSAETIGKVLNAEASTPESLMLEILNSERYNFVDQILP